MFLGLETFGQKISEGYLPRHRKYLQDDEILLSKLSHPTPFDSTTFKWAHYPDYKLYLEIVNRERYLAANFEKMVRIKKPFWASTKKHSAKVKKSVDDLNDFYSQTTSTIDAVRKKYEQFYSEHRSASAERNGAAVKREPQKD